MLNIYISHAAADKAYLDAFLREIKPMQEKYNLRIWYNHPEPEPVIPFPWKILFFWYQPKGSPFPYNRFLHEELDIAHIYLFFTSQNSISTPWIETEEVKRAVSRYREYGNRYIRIFPVVVSSSQWKVFSELASYPVIGPAGKAMNQLPSPSDGWEELLDQLKPVVEDLTRNHKEENKRLGLPVDPKPHPWSDVPTELIPFPKWVGWAMLLGIFFSLARFYDNNCTRKLPPGIPTRNPQPEEYRRENPVQPPEDLVVPRDTAR
jgi:hypothetical protein